MNRLPKWLRWTLVIPAAVLAWVAVSLAVPLAFVLIDAMGIEMPPIAGFMGDYLPQLLGAIGAPYAFVWFGTRMAPAARARVAGVLVAPIVLVNVAAMAFPPYPAWWVVLTSLAGVAAAIGAAVRLARRPTE